MSDVLELLRAINCPILALALIGLVLEVNDTLPSLHVGWRITAAGAGLLLVGGIVGSALKYLNGAPVDVSILLVTGAGLLMIVGLTVLRLRHHQP